MYLFVVSHGDLSYMQQVNEIFGVYIHYTFYYISNMSLRLYMLEACLGLGALHWTPPHRDLNL